MSLSGLQKDGFVMVDAVITWVDGDDPVHSRNRAHYADDAAIQSTETAGLLATRFADLDEVRYCINLIRKNAPWIETIHLVTDNQCPTWLDASARQRLNVALVDHREIFAGFEQYLPTFNSMSIVSLLYRIPGLSDRFIYFNDDIFLIRPTKLSDFFEGNLPKLRGKPILRHPLLRILLPWVRPRSAMPVGMMGLPRKVRYEVPQSVLNLIMISHAPHPILKKDFAAMIEANGRLERNIQHRFRNNSQFSSVALYATLGWDKDQVRLVEPDGLFLDPKLNADSDHILAKAAAGENYHLCAQSLDIFDAATQKKIFNFLERISA